jgi:(4S)-4-hydroxy-5-phosphonooxypentane-2,3-dione isomerase
MISATSPLTSYALLHTMRGGDSSHECPQGVDQRMFALTVRFTIRAGCEQQFFERVTTQARASLDAEAHCRQFDVCRGGGTPQHVFLYEIYTTEADCEAHLATPHFLAFNEATRDWVEQKVVERWERAEGV